MADWETVKVWLTYGFGPNLGAIFVATLITLLVPLILHQWLYRKPPPKSLPTFLMVGPSGAGKTSLLTLLERGEASTTHTSQAPVSVQVSLPEDTSAHSARYRSENDPSMALSKQFLMIDTPGHGKLRHHATARLANADSLRGIIFMVDAANLSSTTSGGAGGGGGGLTEAAEYLHDMLLTLQRRYTRAKTSKGPNEMAVLIAANKLDLFTALPAKLVIQALEAEISRVRDTRARGIKDSGIGMGEDAIAEQNDEEQEWLGEGGEGKFKFSQMVEVNVHVEVVGGNVLGAEGAHVENWWKWIAELL